jgi:arylsulfatase A-like enzyme
LRTSTPIPPLRRLVRTRSEVVDMAPTLAALAGVKPLERLDGHILKQAIK